MGPPPRPGSTIEAIEWTVTLAGEATSGRVWETPSEHVREALPEMQGELHGKGGACGLHCQNLTDLGTDRNEIHVDVDSVGENLAENRALPGDTRAAPPGGVWVAPPGRVWSATLKLDRPIVRVLPVHKKNARMSCIVRACRTLYCSYGGGFMVEMRTREEKWYGEVLLSKYDGKCTSDVNTLTDISFLNGVIWWDPASGEAEMEADTRHAMVLRDLGFGRVGLLL